MRVPITPSVAAVLLAASFSAAPVLAQTQSPTEGQPPRAEARARLLDGRMAMVKETLRLNEAQLKLWAPVEQQIRTNSAKRQKLREEREQRRQAGPAAPPLPDRIDRAAQRASERAERLKAFNDVFRPFYASLSEEQKALSHIVLRGVQGGRGLHRRWTGHRAPGQN